jgi:hypothetical protein
LYKFCLLIKIYFQNLKSAMSISMYQKNRIRVLTVDSKCTVWSGLNPIFKGRLGDVGTKRLCHFLKRWSLEICFRLLRWFKKLTHVKQTTIKTVVFFKFVIVDHVKKFKDYYDPKPAQTSKKTSEILSFFSKFLRFSGK